MEMDIYSYQCKNVLTYLSYFNKISKRAENYYFYIHKYKEFTTEYLIKINSLLNSFTPSFDKANSLKNNNLANNEEIYNKGEDKLKIELNIDLSPLEKITSGIYKDLQEQIKSINFFLKNIEFSLDNFKFIINKTKLDIEKQKMKYINLKNNFLGIINFYNKENEDLLKEFSYLEERIIKHYIFTKKITKYKNQYSKIDTEDNINKKIVEIKDKENTFLQKDKNRLKNLIDFNKEIEDYKSKIKNSIFLLIKIFNLSISTFSKYFRNLLSLNEEKKPVNKINEKKEIKNDEFNEYELIINKYLKKITNDTIQASLIQTKPKKYSTKILKNMPQEIYYILEKGGYNITLSDIQINSDDVINIMKNFKDFNLIIRDENDTEKEKNKLIIEEIIDKMFINKNTNKEKPLEDEANKLFKYLESNKDYRIHFFATLGNKRDSKNNTLTIQLFNVITKIFSFLADIILKEKDYESECNLLILAQTFYKLEKDNKKIFICDSIKDKALFKNEEIWIEYIKYQVSSDYQKKYLIIKSNKNNEQPDQKVIDKRNIEIIFSQILSTNQSMKNFGVDKNKILNIVKFLFDYYKSLDSETREQIMTFIQM
jgi:hypothetical protein